MDADYRQDYGWQAQVQLWMPTTDMIMDADYRCDYGC